MASNSASSPPKITILTESDGVPGSKFESEREGYTVEQLKQWLKCRGLKQSGKKRNLVTRVKHCLATGNHTVLDRSIDNGKWLDLKVRKTNVTEEDNKKK